MVIAPPGLPDSGLLGEQEIDAVLYRAFPRQRPTLARRSLGNHFRFFSRARTQAVMGLSPTVADLTEAAAVATGPRKPCQARTASDAARGWPWRAADRDPLSPHRFLRD